MNMILTFGLTILATAAALLTPAAATATDAACKPHVIQSKTFFPIRSQMRGQRGVVHVSVALDARGRVQTARLHRSSGHRLLDRAAADSIAAHWIFDVAGCEARGLPTDHLVAVEYRNDAY
jgi:protein TonB